MGRKPRCAVCGSKQWHKEPGSGLIACSEGHILQNYRNEAKETDEIGPHAVRKRTIKSTRKIKGPQSKADSRLYHGDRGRVHYFMCLQLILRKQIATLMDIWKLPPEFEAICRDIWALHLTLLTNPPPFEHTSDAPGSSPRPEAGRKNDSSSSSNAGSSDEDEDPELTQLLKENSDISSSSDGEDSELESGDEKPVKRPAKSRKKRAYHKYEGMPNTLVVLMLGCWTCRIPAFYRDFTHLVDLYKLPYLDSVRLLPQSMVVHLTKHNKQALSPAHAPNIPFLHTLTTRLAKLLHRTYGIITPEVNGAPLVWRVCKRFGGNAVTYDLVKRVARLLSLPLTLHFSLAPGLEKIRAGDPESHQYDNVPPEVAMFAVCLIVMKMVYGLDGNERLPRRADDPAWCFPQLSAVLDLIDEDTRLDAKEELFSAKSDMHVEDLTNEEADRYLAFCEGILRADGGDEHPILTEYFPAQQGSPEWAEAPAREKKRLVSLHPPGVMEGKMILGPGQEYAIYSSRDVLGCLPDQFEHVLVGGSRWLGVDQNFLCGVVEKYERRLMRWWDQEKRRSRVSREGDTSMSEEE